MEKLEKWEEEVAITVMKICLAMDKMDIKKEKANIMVKEEVVETMMIRKEAMIEEIEILEAYVEDLNKKRESFQEGQKEI